MSVMIADLVPEVRIEAGHAPEPLVEQRLRDAVIEFCRSTWVWQETIWQRPSVAKRQVYEVDGEDWDARVIAVLTMRHRGERLVPKTPQELDAQWSNWPDLTAEQARVFIPLGPNRFRLVPLPTVSHAQGLTDIRVVLSPSHSADAVPDVLVDNYREGIVAGALYRLLRMPGRAWTQGNLAAVHLETFNAAIGQAKVDALTRWSPASATVEVARVPGMP